MRGRRKERGKRCVGEAHQHTWVNEQRWRPGQKDIRLTS
ncbi:uncharacterized protein G2W53_005965 [Senna tora]|uniref:Uncharacterized protein n=1 Tax=Senna tora TaxID=362788 RepID=A0A834X3C1_9FABA|nr:uncharacterized protein G2W53_005965 [Senna tora]